MISRSWIVALSIVLAAQVTATDIPPQVMGHDALSAVNLYSQATTFRMANSYGDPVSRLSASFVVGTGEDAYSRGGWYDADGYHDLDLYTTPNPTTIGGATCGTYSGYFAGYLDGENADDFYPPAWWKTTSTTAFDQVWWGSFHRFGQFWDMTYSGSNYWYVGYYLESGAKRAARWSSGYSADAPEFFSRNGYDEAEAWCINKDLDVGGQLFSDDEDPPVIWQYNGSTWSVHDVSASQDWPSGASGRIIGITDRISGDSNDPYAIGWLYDGNGFASQPFIYSVGSGRIKFIGSQYGEPTQISNQAYTTSPYDPVVSFSGNSSSGYPYIYVGSPNRDDVLKGAAVDIWAFFDPEVPRKSGSVPTAVTGLNSAFMFGGSSFPGTTGANAWISDLDTDWEQLDVSVDVTKGSHDSGSDDSHFEKVEGTFARILNGIVISGTQPAIIFESTSTVEGTPAGICFRLTSKLAQELSAEMMIYFWNYDLNAWEWVQTIGSVPAHWKTDIQTMLDEDVDQYTSGGELKAKVTLRKTGPGTTGTWKADFDQAVWLIKATEPWYERLGGLFKA